jgi:hypothetical protein
MESYSGQYTKFELERLEAALRELPQTGFAQCLANLHRALQPSPEGSTLGEKETICEEYLPHFLNEGFKCIVIIRDPRDIITSLNYGRGPQFGGRIKPTLFSVRQWRKSVAFALQLEEHPRFFWLRYEDLVNGPTAATNQVLTWLGLSPIDLDPSKATVGQDGEPWFGNSSFGSLSGISAVSVGRFRKFLRDDMTQFIEATCYPELSALGYELSVRRDEIPVAIARFRDPCQTRSDLVEFTNSPERAEEELVRLVNLESTPARFDAAYSLFPRAFSILRAGLNS